MPDVVNAVKFQKKILGIEAAYLQRIQTYRKEARRVLLDIVTRDGVSRPAVNQMVNTLTDLSRNISGAAGITAKDIRYTVQNYTRKNIELANRAGLAKSVDMSPVLNRGANAAADGEQSYMTNQSAWLASIETSIQTQAAKLRMSQAAPNEIVDRLLSEKMADGRASVWASSGNLAKTEEVSNVWNYAVGLLGAYLAIFNDVQEPETTDKIVYMKQAIATIDERTTDCCLQAHGQIQPIDEPFQLNGTPRYADEVQDPPFHWYCRTSEALYHEAFEEFGIPTETMRSAAREELDARGEDDNRAPIYPSHATSRR